MSFRDRSRDPARRRSAPAVERMEARELLSFVLMSHAPRGGHVIHAFATNSGGGGGNSGGSSTPVPSNQLPDLGAPTPREVAKEHFIAKLAGSFVTQPGRFEKEPLQGLILATGGSNQSLRLNAQMQFFLYSDPTLPPSGQIDLTPKNVSSTGSALILDLTADPGSIVHGILPTHYTWTVNSSSAGVYTGATGQGTLDVHYNLRSVPSGVRSSGTAIVVAQGMVVTNHGLSLDISAPGNRPQNP